MYYQSNYFLASFVIFLTVTFFHPHEMMFGLTIMGLLFGLSYYTQSRKSSLLQLLFKKKHPIIVTLAVFSLKREVFEFKEKHPIIVTLAVFSLGYYLVYKMGSVIIVALGILLPFCFVVIHASLRLRNMKNKLSSATEVPGFSKRTPMGIFLEELGIELEFKAN